MIRIAIVENIAEQKQTPSAQKGVIEYCMQPQKTQADERTVYVSGINCVPELLLRCAGNAFETNKKKKQKHDT